MSNANNKLTLLEPTIVVHSPSTSEAAVVGEVSSREAKRRSDLIESILGTDEAFRLLKDLEANPAITQRALADKHSISLGKINYIMSALIDKGIIKAQNFKNSKNKAAYMYVLTPEGINAKASIARNFIKRKMEEYQRLKAGD